MRDVQPVLVCYREKGEERAIKSCFLKKYPGIHPVHLSFYGTSQSLVK
jgi:hypothetical protein